MMNLFVAAVVVYMLGALIGRIDARAGEIICFIGALACVLCGVLVFMRLD